ncbi:hypothetical protein [Streptomyces sp. NPDC059753]|uniref:hypothetical protein n=1 Tax=Streptomyces sp. NPDC059753 TaxID=3346933 RepID=UPI003656DCAE
MQPSHCGNGCYGTCWTNRNRAVEALDDLGSADQRPNPDYAVRAAFRDALGAFADYMDAYRAGVA